MVYVNFRDRKRVFRHMRNTAGRPHTALVIESKKVHGGGQQGGQQGNGFFPLALLFNALVGDGPKLFGKGQGQGPSLFGQGDATVVLPYNRKYGGAFGLNKMFRNLFNIASQKATDSMPHVKSIAKMLASQAVPVLSQSLGHLAEEHGTNIVDKALDGIEKKGKIKIPNSVKDSVSNNTTKLIHNQVQKQRDKSKLQPGDKRLDAINQASNMLLSQMAKRKGKGKDQNVLIR